VAYWRKLPRLAQREKEMVNARDLVVARHLEILEHAKERGFRLPIRIVSMTPNGWTLIMEYPDSPEALGSELLFASRADPSMPVHFLAVDSQGAGLAAILRDGTMMQYGTIGADKP
jgi:hypothetical protein